MTNGQPPSHANPPHTDHYLGLKGAHLVPTTATRTTQGNLRTVVDASAIMCVHGRVGLGKTVAVNTSLRDLAPTTTLRLQFSSSSLSKLRTSLFRLLKLPGDQPGKTVKCDEMIREALSQEFHILVCDEAQWLDTKGLEFFRELHDDPDTDLAIVFVGAENCHEKIRNRPALASRILTWQQFSPLTPDEVVDIMPRYHPLWVSVPHDDVLWINDLACHGNFRNWAKVTYHLQDAMSQSPDLTFSRELVGWVFSKLDSTARRVQPGSQRPR
ncbi:ATP-binding protein [Streptomyces sp. MI02-7b]|uniref:ATP-binding protein n=1 Tax=Streptomyces sp. MI02-7b TaxID=462941 RepID=UPI0029BE543B|nr:ATP-binding protein [Streptomyces sp. MI02-7b]MDX3077865.1 ATP-binding protein [Streptomyces sp. MI02-7b]